jgi:hypothetical protein
MTAQSVAQREQAAVAVEVVPLGLHLQVALVHRRASITRLLPMPWVVMVAAAALAHRSQVQSIQATALRDRVRQVTVLLVVPAS